MWTSPWCSAAWCLATLVALGKNLKQTSHWTRVLSCRVWLANTSGWLVLLWYHRPDSCYGNRNILIQYKIHLQQQQHVWALHNSEAEHMRPTWYDLLQMSQLKGLVPVCVTLCLSRRAALVNTLLHTGHLWNSFGWNSWMCCRCSSSEEKLRQHFWQSWGSDKSGDRTAQCNVIWIHIRMLITCSGKYPQSINEWTRGLLLWKVCRWTVSPLAWL